MLYNGNIEQLENREFSFKNPRLTKEEKWIIKTYNYSKENGYDYFCVNNLLSWDDIVMHRCDNEAAILNRLRELGVTQVMFNAWTSFFATFLYGLCTLCGCTVDEVRDDLCDNGSKERGNRVYGVVLRI